MKRSASELALEEFSRKTTSMNMITISSASASASAFPDIGVHPPISHLSNSFPCSEFSREAAEPVKHVPLSQNLTPKLDSQTSFCDELGNESWGSPVCEGNNPNGRENKVRGATAASWDHDPSDEDEEEDDEEEDEDEEDAETDVGQSEQILDPSHLKRLRRMLSNRESARRSRKRKQEHLADLEFQAEKLRGENDSLFKQLTNAHQLFRDAGTSNRVLRSDVQALRNTAKSARVRTEDMLAGGSFTCGLNQLVQSHMTSPQPTATNNHIQNLGRVVNVSPTVTVHGDGSSCDGFTVFGNTASVGLANVDFSNSSLNNIGIGGDAVSCITQVWP